MYIQNNKTLRQRPIKRRLKETIPNHNKHKTTKRISMYIQNNKTLNQAETNQTAIFYINLKYNNTLARRHLAHCSLIFCTS